MNVLRIFPLLFALWFACPRTSPGAGLAPTLTIGKNFLGSVNTVNSLGFPADVNGAMGPNHFVELLNGTFAVYDKTTGQSVLRTSDTDFWKHAGVTVAPDMATDPRIIYDPISQRWFASMVDVDPSAADPTLNSNDFLLAVSDTSDPTLTWHGFLFRADPIHGNFADFPALAVDNQAVYLAGDFYRGQTNPIAPGLCSIPKADLLATIPVITNRTWFGSMSYDTNGQVLQPVSCFDGSVTGKVVSVTDIGNDSAPHSNLVCFAVQKATAKGATLTPSTMIQTLPWEVPDNVDFGAPLLTPIQPDGTSAVMANDARLSARVNAVSGVIYAVHNTQLNNHLAIRWYRIRASDNTLLESGTIADPTLDFFFPSIAANKFGVVVIGFNACGTNLFISSCAMAGQTLNGATTFGNRVVLQSGATSYHGDDELAASLLGTPPFSRWGDYSATAIDPSDPNRFWTVQMFPSDAANSDVYSTQVTELITTPQIFLNILPSGPNMTITWPAGFAGYQLQTTSSFQSSTTWSNVTQSPSTNGAQLTLVLPKSATQQFFRLKQL